MCSCFNDRKCNINRGILLWFQMRKQKKCLSAHGIVQKALHEEVAKYWDSESSFTNNVMCHSHRSFISLALVSNIYKHKVVKLRHLKITFTHKDCQNCYPLRNSYFYKELIMALETKKIQGPLISVFDRVVTSISSTILKTHSHILLTWDRHKKMLYIFNSNNLVSLEITVQPWAQHHSLCQKISINSKFPTISSLYIFLFLLLPPPLPHYYYYYCYYVVIRALNVRYNFDTILGIWHVVNYRHCAVQ